MGSTVAMGTGISGHVLMLALTSALLNLGGAGTALAASTFVITDAADNTDANGLCSLREAWNAHESSTYSEDCGATGNGQDGGDDNFELAAGTTYTVNAPFEKFSRGGVYLWGKDEMARIVANHWGYGFYMNGSGRLHLYKVVLTNFRASVVVATGPSYASVADSEITGNLEYTTQSVGVVAGPDASVSVHRSRIHNNAGIKGAGVLVYSKGAAYIFDSIIENNRASQYGGGVLVMDRGSLYCQRSLFRSNSAGIRGGGVSAPSIYSSQFSMGDCQAYSNTAPASPDVDWRN